MSLATAPQKSGALLLVSSLQRKIVTVHWRTDDGLRRTFSKEELIQCIQNGTLSPYGFIYRRVEEENQRIYLS